MRVTSKPAKFAADFPASREDEDADPAAADLIRIWKSRRHGRSGSRVSGWVEAAGLLAYIPANNAFDKLVSSTILGRSS
jgi:hypothetical protein